MAQHVLTQHLSTSSQTHERLVSCKLVKLSPVGSSFETLEGPPEAHRISFSTGSQGASTGAQCTVSTVVEYEQDPVRSTEFKQSRHQEGVWIEAMRATLG